MRKPSLDKLTKHNMDDAPDGRWIEAIKGVANDTARQVEYIRSENHGINLLKHADVELATMDVQVPDPWIPMTLQGGWVSTGSGCVYRKGPDGLVEIIMTVDAGAGIIFTMPVGYRPARNIYVAGWTGAPATFREVLIASSGNITQPNDVGVSFQITYLSSDATPIPLSCWPKFIKTKFKSVASVTVAKVVDAETTKQLPAGVVLNPVWEMSTQNGTPQVKLLNIAGLPYNRKSTVSLLIVGG